MEADRDALQGTLRERRRYNPARQVLEATGLYHSFELPDGTLLNGTVPLERLRERFDAFPLPRDLTGKLVLDIGPWDGFFTFEAERRGAAVTAVDYVDLDSFREIARRMKSRARYERMEVYQLDPVRHGTFDYVLFLGVLYHCKHPLLALERVCSVTRDLCIVETHVADAVDWQRGERRAYPFIDLYEHDELGGQFDNWTDPSVDAVAALLRMAGFASAGLLRIYDDVAAFAAYRHWRNLPPDSAPPVTLHGISSHWNRGHSFRNDREEYLEMWCEWPGDAPPVAGVYPEIAGFGVAPLAAIPKPEGLLVSVRLPPGLLPGTHHARVKIGTHGWSNPLPFHIGLPESPAPLRLMSVQDGVGWKDGITDWASGAWLTVWIDGLTPEADPGNTVVEIGGIPHAPEDVFPAKGQINVRLRPIVAEGLHTVSVTHGGARSNQSTVRVTGQRPALFR
jgi:tRNA (mo5U34)-methyltransferase